MIFYSLNRSNALDPNIIIRDISKLLEKTSNEVLQQSVLIIKLEKVSDYAGDSLMPKITYEGDSLT